MLSPVPPVPDCFSAEERRVSFPITDQEIKVEEKAWPGEGLEHWVWPAQCSLMCSLLTRPQAGPPSPIAEVWVESAAGLGTQVTMTSLPSAKAQSAYLLTLYHFSCPASSIWAQGYLRLCLG